MKKAILLILTLALFATITSAQLFTRQENGIFRLALQNKTQSGVIDTTVVVTEQYTFTDEEGQRQTGNRPIEGYEVHIKYEIIRVTPKILIERNMKMDQEIMVLENKLRKLIIERRKNVETIKTIRDK